MTAKLSEEDIKAKLARFRSAFLASPFLKAVLNELDECRELSKLGGDPECIIVTGDTGAGKTSLINKYLELNARNDSYEGTLIPVLSTTLPGEANSVALFQQILADLGHPYPFESSNEVALRKQIKAIAQNCGLELIIIDEFQHLIERKSLKILKETANSIKSLIVDTKIPMALFGMPYSSVILGSVSQLSSRFERRRILSPFRISTDSELQNYQAFLSKFETLMELAEPSELASEEMYRRLYSYSSGNFRKLKNLLNEAFKAALENGERSISQKRLAETASQRSSVITETNNPFLLPIEKLKISEPGEYVGWDDYNQGKGGNVQFKDKPKVLNFSDVF
ncbi:TniB family NTP-binding protein [Arsukibacterium sp.]|uniref:TniB family NTP-binding protein n=1 Tax=Arsukibacterium sp. TaxID=1977258 RepID=UPI00299E74DA|nr:TniB family NTP-binding protein [Arsukibacterium sp.]MDX1539585.1 TniB family NTP-binding protein [Arsukibacterium sp.]